MMRTDPQFRCELHAGPMAPPRPEPNNWFLVNFERFTAPPHLHMALGSFPGLDSLSRVPGPTSSLPPARPRCEANGRRISRPSGRSPAAGSRKSQEIKGPRGPTEWSEMCFPSLLFKGKTRGPLCISRICQCCARFSEVCGRPFTRWCDRQRMRNGMTPTNHPVWFPFRGPLASCPTTGSHSLRISSQC